MRFLKSRNKYFSCSLLESIPMMYGGVRLFRVALIVLMMHLGTPGLPAQEWPVYGGDLGGQKYSPLRGINNNNVAKLEIAWTYDTGDFSDGTLNPVRSAFETTPLSSPIRGGRRLGSRIIGFLRCGRHQNTPACPFAGLLVRGTSAGLLSLLRMGLGSGGALGRIMRCADSYRPDLTACLVPKHASHE